MPRSKILITDYPWPNLDIERSMIDAAGYELVSGPSVASDATTIQALVAEHEPIAIMCCWSPVSSKAMEASNGLRVVARLGVGLDNIDVAAATARGAWVTNVPDYCAEEVSDHAIAMLLNYTRGIGEFDRAVKRGEWNPSSAKLLRLRNLVVGVIGYGVIGRMTAHKLSQGFSCRVLVNAPSILRMCKSGEALAPNVFAAELSEIRQHADAMILHLPLTPHSRQLVDKSFLAACKRRPYLINVSRGGLVDNDALREALASGLLAGAALDVVDGEPTPPMNLVGRDDVVVTPHIAFTSDASLRELRERCTQDVLRVLRGESPLHPCNRPSIK